MKIFYPTFYVPLYTPPIIISYVLLDVFSILNISFFTRKGRKTCDELWLVEYKIEYKKWDRKFSFVQFIALLLRVNNIWKLAALDAIELHHRQAMAFDEVSMTVRCENWRNQDHWLGRQFLWIPNRRHRVVPPIWAPPLRSGLCPSSSLALFSWFEPFWSPHPHCCRPRVTEPGFEVKGKKIYNWYTYMFDLYWKIKSHYNNMHIWWRNLATKFFFVAQYLS